MGDPIETFFTDYSASVAATSQALRALIREAAPQAEELLDTDRKHLGYTLSGGLDQAAILLAPKKDFVLLVFEQSNELPDPDGLLGNAGKPVRFMTIKTPQDANNPAVKQLIEAAWAIAQEQKI